MTEQEKKEGWFLTAAARKITVDSINDSVDRFDDYLKEANGQAAAMAKNAGLVDQVGPRDLLRQRLIEIVGEDKDTGSYYRIGMASDQVWAYPTTITGSIGIFGMIPTFQETLKKYLGINVDGVGTNKFAGVLRVDREMSPGIKEIIQQLIDRGYDQFITMVAKARNKTPEQVHEIAQGRVWIGSDAHKLGLVDHMGGMWAALDSAAKLAKLEKPYNIKYFRKKKDFWRRLWNQLFTKAFVKEQTRVQSQLSLNPFTDMMRILVKQIKRFAQFNDPNGVYAYWLYDIDF